MDKCKVNFLEVGNNKVATKQSWGVDVTNGWFAKWSKQKK